MAYSYWFGDSFGTKFGASITDGWATAIYFSFVTITTLGYGDFAPQTWFGQCLVAVEVIFGFLLLIIALQLALAAEQQNHSKSSSLSDQLREIIKNGSLTLDSLAEDSGVDASQLSLFYSGTGSLTNASLDKIGKVLKLRLESDSEQ